MKRIVSFFLVFVLYFGVSFSHAAYPTTTEHHKLYPYTSVMASPYSCDNTGSINVATAIELIKANQSNAGTIYFPKGTYKLATNLTIPVGIRIERSAGAKISIATGVILTFNGDLQETGESFFTLNGTAVVDFSSNTILTKMPIGTWPINSNTTFSSNIQIPYGCIFAVSAGTLTFNGALDTGLYQVFSCTGTGKVAFGKGTIKVAHPEWFGCNVAGTGAANALALQSCLDSICHTNITYGNTVAFGEGTYTVTGPVVVQSTVNFKGINSYASIIYNDSTVGGNLFNLVNDRDTTLTPYYVSFEDLYFKGNYTNAGSRSGDCIYAERPFYFYMNRCNVTNHGGIGLNFILGTSSPYFGQSIFIDQTQIQSNQLGGVRLFGALANATIQRSVFSACGYYGVYESGVSNLTVDNCQFNAFNWGRVGIPAVQHYPIVLSTGSVIRISSNRFENNGGEVAGTAIGSPIKTAMNGDTQAAVASNTSNLVIVGNEFSANNGHQGDLNYIDLDYVINCTIGPGNLFNKSTLFSGTVNGVKLGTGIGYSAGILFLNNRWGASLDAKLAGAYASTQYMWQDASDVLYGNTAYGNVGRPTTDVAFWTRRYDKAINTFQVDQLGNISLSDGDVVAQTMLTRQYLKLTELAADPDAPATNECLFYLKDNGAGKTQFCVRFATGAVQVLSTQP